MTVTNYYDKIFGHVVFGSVVLYSVYKCLF